MTHRTPAPFAHPGFSGLIGCARGDITPPAGIYSRCWGAAAHDVAEGIHRPLRLAALTIQSKAEDSPLVLIAADLGWWQNLDDEWLVRGGVIEALSLDPSRVMLALSHTHSGPVLAREYADRKGGELIVPYLDKLRQTAITVVRATLAARAPATLEWNHGKCSLATNRDLPDPERARIVCGFNPERGADDTLLVGRVTSDDGKILGTIVNYACHPTTLAWDNRLISPDYVGAMREVIESRTGGAPCLFLQGASGELSPREQYVGDTAVADAHGRHLGFAVLAALAGMLPARTRLAYAGTVESGAPLALWKRETCQASQQLAGRRIEVEIPLRKLPCLAEIETELKGCRDRVTAERLARKRGVRRIVGDGTSARRKIWVWRLGDAFLVGQADEAYSQLQTELRRLFPKNAVAVMNVVNGSCAYMAPANLYDQDVYQVWQSPFERGCLERMTKACEDGIRALASP